MRRRSHKKVEKPKEYGMYEEPSPYLKVGIYINNLRKVYKNDVIGLDGLNMNLYKDVITVLLGHNGAGKTSLMGIISGTGFPFDWFKLCSILLICICTLFTVCDMDGV